MKSIEASSPANRRGGGRASSLVCGLQVGVYQAPFDRASIKVPNALNGFSAPTTDVAALE